MKYLYSQSNVKISKPESTTFVIAEQLNQKEITLANIYWSYHVLDIVLRIPQSNIQTYKIKKALLYR